MKNSLTYLKGNIFSSPAEFIVNPVNTFGVMGKGLAAEFKRRYPEMFKKYRTFCKEKSFSVGQLLISKEKDYSVLLFPTKKHWHGHSKFEYIEAGLKKFVETYEKKNITSIAFPKLGCGYGGLDWKDVRPLMEKYLSDLPIKIYIYLDNEQDLTDVAGITLNKDFSVEGVFSAFGEHLKENSTLEFIGKNFKVTLENKVLLFDGDKEEFSVDEIFLKSTINDISKQKVFRVAGNKPEFNLTAALLQKIGYLSNVLIQSEDDKFCSGYQLNCGLIRAAKKNQQGIQISLFDS